MKLKLLNAVLLIAVLSMFAVFAAQAQDALAELRDATAQYHRPEVAQAAGKDDIARVREATLQFHRTPATQAAGYNLVPGFDDCFQNYGIGGMGYHYINVNLLDTTVDLLHPEAIVYASDANGFIQLGAVEYIVPANAWDAEHDELPQVLGQNFHLDERLGVYVLHAWIWKNNPSGMFEDWNPDVSCPAPRDLRGPLRAR